MKKSFKPKAWLLPQPVLIIGTYDENGVPNAMNAAWGGQWDYNKIMISLGKHATTRNLNNCPDFTVAFATADSLPGADYVGLVSAKTEPYKIAHTGWEVQKAGNVNAPVFGIFPMALECRVSEKIQESETGFYLIADIVGITCDERFLAEDGKPDIEKMNLITFDPIHNGYIALGKRVGNAFSDRKSLK